MKKEPGNMELTSPYSGLACLKRENGQVLVHYLPGNTLFVMPECCWSFIKPITLDWMDDYLPAENDAPYPVLLNLDGKIYDRSAG